LTIAIQKINGTVLTPGEEFSYNKTLGERTVAAGYKEAKIYSAGQVVDGLGGGICQISSTLYNAVLLANLEVTERRNHQFVTSYVPAGRDATVVYGSQDFKFKNSRKYPIKIQASISSGIAKISIYGLQEEKEYDISFQTNTLSTIPYTTEYIDDSSLSAGEEVVKQKGTNGLITETYKIVKLNGVVVSKTFLSKDTYNAMDRIIRRGVGATTTTEQTTTNNTVNKTPVETTTEPENTTPVENTTDTEETVEE
jgi:vancomycin resistance protein YoaR